MPCYSPLEGYRAKEVNANGKRPVVFNPGDGFTDMPIKLPCGQCNGCRLERSRQWAVRCMHESQMHDKNCFLTLTYNNENLPPDMSVNVRHFQLFMKKLRKKFGSGIRFFHCGEYGEKFARPHYHALIFGLDFEDRKLHSVKNGVPLYTSETLDSLWGMGYATIGDVTFESAAYVARYIMKKINGELADEHYLAKDPQGNWIYDPETGEILKRTPEYTTMSRRPGIGKPWLDKFQSDVYPHDFIVVNGKKVKPPKAYDANFEITDPVAFRQVKRLRKLVSNDVKENNTPERLKVREKVLALKLRKLLRKLDSEL